MTDAWLVGDKERAFALYDKWMINPTPEQEMACKLFLGNDYDEMGDMGIRIVQ